VNWSALLVALVPSAVVTVTSTVPVPSGATATICVAVLVVIDAAAVAPNFTAVADDRSVPVIVTVVPPALGPVVGLIDVTTGELATSCVTVAELVE